MHYQSVDEYISAQPTSAHSILNQVRVTLQAALPAAQEQISYNIPAYKIAGAPIIYFAGWKKHFSLYPATSGVLAACKAELANYRVNKGTIRFPLTTPVPVELIQRIAKLRAEEAARSSK